MNDIVERLRKLGTDSVGNYGMPIATEAADEIERVRAELEDERMRHAACGVIAGANTEQSAKQQRQMAPKYWSASVQAVADAVDREMRLRAERDALTSLTAICACAN